MTGLVDHERSWSYEQLRRMATVEADVTIACVSNEVGGDLVGTARWQGVPLPDLLEAAGVHDDARQVVGRARGDGPGLRRSRRSRAPTSPARGPGSRLVA